MRPDQFLFLARELLKTQKHPAGFRSAVSRAYYAAHHHIKAFIESAGVSVLKSEKAHMDVCRHLAEIGDTVLEEVGNDLITFKSDRNEADYDLLKPQFEKEANASDRVELAQGLIEAVEECRKDAVRFGKVVGAIKQRNRFLRGENPPAAGS